MTDLDDDLLPRVRDAVGERYRVTRVIGRGGMATVYLADDVRHERSVAIKVLAPELGAIIGAERFLKEIKVTAHLQHPNILGLIDSGESNGLLWYAMPFVDGESLRQRLERERQLPVSEAIRIARDVADALHHAHRQGVIHRDVKPENVLLRDGRALVADFGIALAASRAGGSRLTGTGLSLGTPSYMSPEQAQGDRELDARTDQYSLAAMVYEMLAGQPPHVGPTVQALMAGLLTKEPESLAALRPSVPAHVVAAVHTGLAKLPADRFPTTADFESALVDPARSADSSPAIRRSTHAPLRQRTALAAAGALLAGLGIGYATFGAQKSEPVAPTFAFEVGPDSGVRITDFWPQLSFDGSAVFYSGTSGPSTGIYIRSLNALTSRRLAGTDSVPAGAFAVAADGRSVLALSSGRFTRFGLDGTSVVVPTPTIERNPEFVSGAGLPDGGFAVSVSWQRGTRWGFFHFPADGTPPRRVSVGGDSGAVVTSVSALETPGRVLVAQGFIDNSTIGVVDLSTGDFTRIRDGMSPSMLGPDALLFADRGGAVMAQRVDYASGKTDGTPRRIIENAFLFFELQAAVSASRNGTVVVMRRSEDEATLRLSSASGETRVIMGGVKFWEPRFSPDGQRIAFARYLSSENFGEMWLYDLRTQTDQRLSSIGVKGADVNDAVWSPDGRTLAVSAYDSTAGYGQNRGKSIWLMAVDGQAPMRRIIPVDAHDHWTAAFTPDGAHLLYVRRTNPDDRREIWQLPIAGGAPTQLVQSPFNVSAPRVSPDGKWLAYDSDETGRREVYVQRYPESGDRVRISRNGGRAPVFTRGGSELIYWDGTSLVSVPIRLGTTSPVGAPRILMPVTFPSYTELPQFDVSADGKTIVVVQAAPPTKRAMVLTSQRPDTSAARR